MRSIRFFLVATLLAGLTLMVFLSALHGYRSSLSEADRLMDSELAYRAALLAAAGEGTSVVAVERDDPHAFQIWRDGVLLHRSENSPVQPMMDTPGYKDLNFSGHRWHVFALETADGTRAITAQRLDYRNQLTEDIIVKAILPVLMTLPFLGVLVWLIVSYGMAPLRALAKNLQGKQADDLSPIPLQGQPKELTQLVFSSNVLLNRLRDAFTRERQFSSDAAHELRTPISALKVHISNLQREYQGDQNDLMPLRESIDRMDRLVRQLLLLYRTAPDQFAERMTEVDLHEMAQNLIADMYPIFADRNIDVTLEGGRAKVLGNAFALETLLKNLLDNAAKYAGVDSQIRVTVRQDRQSMLLRVEDSGPGVPGDQYQRVFDRFYRVGGDHHGSKVVGCGLGLAIVQHIAQRHHAEIEAGPSGFESGLAITLRFPLLGGERYA